MTLQQLRFLTAIVESDFNITAAAAKLHATQPAVSRQLLLLEQELGFQIFSRSGRGLSRMTAAGQQVIEHARRALRETQNIKNVSAELSDPRRGELRIGSTHTEARYILPEVIRRFRPLFPGVRLSLHQGTPEQIAELARLNRIDVAIATGSRESFEQLICLPCFRGSRRAVVPASHPLAGSKGATLAKLGSYPIAMHVFTASEIPLHEEFGKAGVEAHVALTTRDAELIKTYVRLGLGVGIIADLAFEPDRDQDLAALDISHLFPEETTWAGFSREGVLRQYMYEFLALLAPHLTRERIDRVRGSDSPESLEELYPITS
jgi:LysR family transcriptional regulator, cys regulon transcriptional activator